MNKDEVQLFKSGNSYAFRISKKDRELLDIKNDTKFRKNVSPDGNVVTFTKVSEPRKHVLENNERLFKKNRSLMKRLEDL